MRSSRSSGPTTLGAVRACARTLAAFAVAVLGAAATARAAPLEPAAAAQSVPPIAIDADWQVLAPVADLRGVAAGLESAATALGDWRIEVGGVPLDAAALRGAARRARKGPVVRAVREQLRRAFDPIDLLRFLDDVLVAGQGGRRGEPFCVPEGRARGVGILIHPDEVFEGHPRVYPAGESELHVDRPRPPEEYAPAQDGDPLGPRWSSRFPNPVDEAERIASLRAVRPDYAARVVSLMKQLRAQGADVELTSTVRPRQRGYLMWGAFVLSRSSTAAELESARELIAQRNREWSLDIPILWSHPQGWEATREAARAMADAYDVVFATENGAHSSNHYTGVAVDLVAAGLPRKLRLVAPGGRVKRTFDLSAADETRDLSLSPKLIDWIETQFGVRKLRSDYPHWEDTHP